MMKTFQTFAAKRAMIFCIVQNASDLFSERAVRPRHRARVEITHVMRREDNEVCNENADSGSI